MGLLGWTECYLVLPSFTEFCSHATDENVAHTSSYRVLPGFSKDLSKFLPSPRWLAFAFSTVTALISSARWKVRDRTPSWFCCWNILVLWETLFFLFKEKRTDRYRVRLVNEKGQSLSIRSVAPSYRLSFVFFLFFYIHWFIETYWFIKNNAAYGKRLSTTTPTTTTTTTTTTTSKQGPFRCCYCCCCCCCRCCCSCCCCCCCYPVVIQLLVRTGSCCSRLLNSINGPSSSSSSLSPKKKS